MYAVTGCIVTTQTMPLLGTYVLRSLASYLGVNKLNFKREDLAKSCDKIYSSLI